MATCIALLIGDLDHKQMPHWVSTDLFEEHIAHVEQLTGLDVAAGSLTADAFLIPPKVNPKSITGLALFDCDTSLISERYGFQLPALGIQCLPGGQNILCIRGWCDEPDDLAPTEYESDCAILDDPCALYKELKCCLFNLCKKDQKVSISFRDRSVSFKPKDEAGILRLERMVLEAKAECDACTGEPSTWRGGRMKHSCKGSGRRKSGCC